MSTVVMQSENVANLVRQVPKKMLLQIKDDKLKIKEIISHLDTNRKNEVENLNRDKFIKGCIHKYLRVMNMKINNIDLLLLCGLKNVTDNDLNITRKDLVLKLIEENQDKNNSYILNRISGTIRTKLPNDLQERLYHSHDMIIKECIYKELIKIKSSEEFSDLSNFDLSEIDTPDELSMFHMELTKFRKDSTYNNQEKNSRKTKKLKGLLLII